MFKDYDRYLLATLKVYIFVLICIFILKLCGLNYFGLSLNNSTLISISNYLSNSHLGDLYFITTLYIQAYFYLCLATNKKKLYKESVILTLVLYIPQCILNVYYKIDWIYPLWCLIIDIIIPMIVLKKFTIKSQIKYILLMNVYQLISLFIRNVGINTNYNNFLVDSLLNIDQLLLFAITYNVHFLKGDEKLCGVEQVQCSFSQMKKSFLQLLKKWQKYLQEFKKLNEEEKYTLVVYSILSLFWNCFTVVTVLFIATINDTIIECIFILISFWISKRIFGKAFHLKSMLQCFILSNITYYILNRITTPIGISIIIPIMLGSGLSYVTSKLVKKTYKPLYKGMPIEEFNNSILRVTEKDSLKYNVCYDYFIERENAIFLGRKYNYTEAGIRKIASRINEKIKALN